MGKPLITVTPPTTPTLQGSPSATPPGTPSLEGSPASMRGTGDLNSQGGAPLMTRTGTWILDPESYDSNSNDGREDLQRTGRFHDPRTSKRPHTGNQTQEGRPRRRVDVKGRTFAYGDLRESPEFKALQRATTDYNSQK